MGIAYSWMARSIGVGTITFGLIVFSKKLWSLLERDYDGRRSRGVGGSGSDHPNGVGTRFGVWEVFLRK
jgi:hypothetical protein